MNPGGWAVAENNFTKLGPQARKREGVGAKKFGMPFETREIKLFWRDIPGFCRDIPEAPEKFEKKMFGFNFRSLKTGFLISFLHGAQEIAMIWHQDEVTSRTCQDRCIRRTSARPQACPVMSGTSRGTSS